MLRFFITHLLGSKTKAGIEGYPAGGPRQKTGRAGWMPCGSPRSPRILPGSLISPVQLNRFPTLDLSGIGERGAEATPSYYPMGPSPGGSRVCLLCGAQGAGWPRLQDLAGLPVGPQGKIWGGTEFPNSGRGPEGVGHSPQDLLSSYKQGNGVPRVQGLTVDTFVHVRACTHTHTTHSRSIK